jgi:peptidoglycan/xylan/chitin deacetylase (PgdA/CDA1 family)
MAGSALKTAFNLLHYSGATWATGRRFAGRGAILMLHHVRKSPNAAFSPNRHLDADPQFLDALLHRLAARGFEFVSMDEAVSRLSERQQSGANPFIAITLDDGYRDNLANAAPVFRKHAAPFTVFVAPGLVEGLATLWWEDLEAVIAKRDHIVMRSPERGVRFELTSLSRKRRAFNELIAFFTGKVSEAEQRKMVSDLAWQAGVDTKAHLKSQMMSWAEIAELSRDRLCTIGAHTIHHYAVARLSPDEARTEMLESARIIEMETGNRPNHFAYPYGYPAAAGPRDFSLARECGFASAVTTRHGVLHDDHASHLHALPRISINGNFQKIRHVETMLSGLTTLLANRGAKINVG